MFGRGTGAASATELVAGVGKSVGAREIALAEGAGARFPVFAQVAQRSAVSANVGQGNGTDNVDINSLYTIWVLLPQAGLAAEPALEGTRDNHPRGYSTGCSLRLLNTR